MRALCMQKRFIRNGNIQPACGETIEQMNMQMQASLPWLFRGRARLHHVLIAGEEAPRLLTGGGSENNLLN